MTRAVSELDSYVCDLAHDLTVGGDGLWIEAPKDENRLWLAARLSEHADPEAIRYRRTLQDALALLRYKTFGEASHPDFPEEGAVYRLLLTLAHVRDSLMISGDDEWWVLQAENLKLHTVSKHFFDAVEVMQQAVDTHLSQTLHVTDNDPED
jgi:hypothetical protein